MADLPIGRRVPMPARRPAAADNDVFMGMAPPDEQFVEGMTPPDTAGSGGDPRQELIEFLIRQMQGQADRSR